MEFITCQVTWEDQSSGSNDEIGQELQIWTDSPSFRPDVPVNPAHGPHPWMKMPLIAAGETEAQFPLETPVTFITFRVRQYNGDGPGDWSIDSGTTFSISNDAGANVPPAPANVGFAVLSTTTPPPPPPPVDPPPPPPPTGGGGSSSNYVFTSQFSGVQGQNGWSYRDSSGASLTYSSADAKWNGDELYLAIWNGGFRHSSSGTGKDAVLRWTAPTGGTALVSGTAQLFSAPGNVRFIAKHNSTTKFTSTDMTNTTAEPYSFTAVMLAGDTLDFISQRTSVALNNNNMLLNPTIQFTTDGSTPANPTVSSISPSSFTVSTGGTFPLTVNLTSAAIEAAVVSLSSSDAARISVPASITIPIGQSSGIFSATGVAPGTATITATYNSTNATSAGTDSAPASASWANAPVGGTVLKDINCTNAPATYGLFDVYGTTLLTADATAPFSPNGTWRARLEAFAGQGGNQLEYNSPTSYREMYFGLYWRSNPQYQGRTVGNKLFFLSRDSGLNGVFLWHNSSLVNGAGVLHFSCNTQNLFNPQLFGGSMDPSLPLWPNVGDGTMVRGVWYKIEAYIKASTTRTSQDGILKWWIDDRPVGSYTNINYCGPNGETLNRWMQTQTWDGAGDMGTVNTVAWEHYIDHLYIVGKN